MPGTSSLLLPRLDRGIDRRIKPGDWHDDKTPHNSLPSSLKTYPCERLGSEAISIIMRPASAKERKLYVQR